MGQGWKRGTGRAALLNPHPQFSLYCLLDWQESSVLVTVNSRLVGLSSYGCGRVQPSVTVASGEASLGSVCVKKQIQLEK